MSCFAHKVLISAVVAFVASSAIATDFGRTKGALGVSGGSANYTDLGQMHLDYVSNTKVKEFTLVNNPSHGFWTDGLETMQD